MLFYLFMSSSITLNTYKLSASDNIFREAYSPRSILSIIQIGDLITDYADAIDTLDIDRLDTLFTPDAYIDYSAMGGAVGSYSVVKAFLKEALPVFANTQHMISNFQIKLDGDKATGKIMCFNPMELNMGEDQQNAIFFLGLWYIDEYVKTDDGWRIAKRSEEKSYDFNTPDFMSF